MNNVLLIDRVDELAEIQTSHQCYHCGEDCDEKHIVDGDKHFCCNGCHTVYQLIDSKELCTYYDFTQFPGKKGKIKTQSTYQFLENEEIVAQLINFKENNFTQIVFYIPSVHCTSCVWLLEHLQKVQNGVLQSRVDFIKKQVTIDFDNTITNARELAEILDVLGYAPYISSGKSDNKGDLKEQRSLLYKIGVAGFCAGNIMLLSFPEYLGLDTAEESFFKPFLGYLNLILSIPVVLYSASDYFIGAYQGLKNKVLTLDVPIVIGTLAVFTRSIFEVLSNTGAGYFDSLTGLILFLMIGKWFQKHTYQALSFDKDYLSYFPIAISKIFENGKEEYVLLNTLKKGDFILVKNNEIIPADGLLYQDAVLDYSFVTGESKEVLKKPNELVFAGAKNKGKALKIKLEKSVSQSYLMDLWAQKKTDKKSDVYLSKMILSFSRYFTLGTLVIALATFIGWTLIDSQKALFAVTSVLLVACPCALALSIPFALSNTMRWLGKVGLFLKSTDVVEKIAQIDTIIFDKTGTITSKVNNQVSFEGTELSNNEIIAVKSLASQSPHPLSRAIANFYPNISHELTAFKEYLGQGLEGECMGIKVRMGSPIFLNQELDESNRFTNVGLEINGQFRGYFYFSNEFRKRIDMAIVELGRAYDLHLLSGDTNQDEMLFKQRFGTNLKMTFKADPHHKMSYVKTLQRSSKQVAMIGDGLNDAGALLESNVGIAVMDDIYGFSPASDAIIEGNQIGYLPKMLIYIKQSMNVVKISLVISLLYNAIGLYFAISGQLSPLVAAILMPMSSITVVAFVVVFTSFYGSKLLRTLRYSTSS